VQESPQFEIKYQIIALGNRVEQELNFMRSRKIHINEAVLDENGAIDQFKIDLVSRLGGNWYSRSNQGLFEVPKPLATGIG
jgi:hypothetical protein